MSRSVEQSLRLGRRRTSPRGSPSVASSILARPTEISSHQRIRTFLVSNPETGETVDSAEEVITLFAPESRVYVHDEKVAVSNTEFCTTKIARHNRDAAIGKSAGAF